MNQKFTDRCESRLAQSQLAAKSRRGWQASKTLKDVRKLSSPLIRMKKLLPALHGANRKLAEWYLDLLGDGTPLPHDHDSNDVAQAVGVSRPTVIRFARALGYSGFTALRHALLQSTGPSEVGEEADTLYEEISRRYVHSLELTLGTIDSGEFQLAVEWLAKAPTIFWLGWGDSYFAAASAEHKCYLCGISTRSANDFADLDMLLDPLAPGSVVVVISQSGRWDRIAMSLEPVQARGIKVICVTGTASSLLANLADLTFVTANPTYRLGVRPFTLRPAQLALIDALILGAAELKGQTITRPEEKL